MSFLKLYFQLPCKFIICFGLKALLLLVKAFLNVSKVFITEISLIKRLYDNQITK